MPISNRTLLYSILIGLVVVLGCGLPGGVAPAASPPAEPGILQPTEEETSSGEPTANVPAPTPQPAMPERRRLTLEFPPRIRAGDSDIVRLRLEVDDLGNVTPTAEIGGNVVTGEVIEIPNLYETHHVVAEARFDIAGMEVRPAELISQPLAQGNPAVFFWSIRPQEVGVYRGTIWLYLRFVDKSSAEESRKAVSAQIVEIEAVNLMGLSGGFARTTGLIGSVIGTILGLPFFEEIIKFLLKRRSRQS